VHVREKNLQTWSEVEQTWNILHLQHNRMEQVKACENFYQSGCKFQSERGTYVFVLALKKCEWNKCLLLMESDQTR